MALDTHRLRMWQQKEKAGYFFENRLHVYFIWDARVHAKLYHSAQQKRQLDGFTMSQKKAIQRTRREHETYLAEFESILRGIEGSMEGANLGPRRLSTQELFEELKHSQHPTRRDHRPFMPGEEMFAYLDPEIGVNLRFKEAENRKQRRRRTAGVSLDNPAGD